MKCGYFVHKGQRIFMPQCMGSAVYGKHRCTCSSKPRWQLMEERLERLEVKVNNLLQEKENKQ